MLHILFAFIAGLLTIAAPCILLPLPIILGASIGQQRKTRPLFITLGFVCAFTLLALSLNFLIQALHIPPNALRDGAAVILAIFALFMIWPTPFERLMAHMSGMINMAEGSAQKLRGGNASGFLLGVIIGVVWAPCAGPILGAILTLIALEHNTVYAGALLLAYAVGAGVPMLAIAYGGQALTTRIRGIAKYATRLQQVFGIVLLLLAGAIFLQYDTAIELRLATFLPNLSGGIETGLVRQGQTDPLQLPLRKGEGTIPELHNYGQAPEFAGVKTWLNSDPLTMASLKGKVVLIDFWTYSCINCLRTLPYVTKWYDTYKDQGLVVIGVHTPEFAFEKVPANVQNAIVQQGIHYPVALDSDYGTWNAYSNQYWPAEYLVDKAGNVVYTHFGEGEYDHTENAIRKLLGIDDMVGMNNGQDLSKVASPEMYFGTDRLQNLNSAQTPSTSSTAYTFPSALDLNTFALQGQWTFTPEHLKLDSPNGKIRLHFSSAKVHLVSQSSPAQIILVSVDGEEPRPVQIDGSNLYTLFDSEDYRDHTLEITVPNVGFEAFTFTFG